MSIYVTLDDRSNHTEFADYIELNLLYSGEESASRAEVLGDLASNDPGDANLDMAFNEIRRRSQLGDIYPFEEVDRLIVRREPGPDEVRLYEFLLLASAAGTDFRKLRQYGQADQLFDELIAAAMKRFLGPGSNSIVFAHPSLNPITTSTGFVERVDALGTAIGVGKHGPAAAAFLNDGGVDVVAWRRFEDAGLGFPLYLLQNTVRARYMEKRRDVVLEEWAKFLPGAGAMSKGLAIPGVADVKSTDLIGISNQVVLDRLRTCALLGPEAYVDAQIAGHVHAFIQSQIVRPEGYVPDGVVRPARARRAKVGT